MLQFRIDAAILLHWESDEWLLGHIQTELCSCPSLFQAYLIVLATNDCQNLDR